MQPARAIWPTKREARTPFGRRDREKRGAGDATSFARPPLTHVHVICIGSAIATGSLSRVDFSASSERPKMTAFFGAAWPSVPCPCPARDRIGASWA